MNNEDFFDLDFHQGIPSHSFVDKENGVKINIGRVGIVPSALDRLRRKYGEVLLGVQQCGMEGGDLDRICNLLAPNCKSLRIDILVGKSDRDFDSQWYFFGDIKEFLKAAEDRAVKPPFASTMHEHILRAIRVVAKINP